MHMQPAESVGNVAHNSEVQNGISATDLPVEAWFKSSLSNPSGNCVEMASLPGQQVAVRNSRDPQGPALIYTRDEIVALLHGVRNGDFDHLVE